jgi:hypothetical protein
LVLRELGDRGAKHLARDVGQRTDRNSVGRAESVRLVVTAAFEGSEHGRGITLLERTRDERTLYRTARLDPHQLFQQLDGLRASVLTHREQRCSQPTSRSAEPIERRERLECLASSCSIPTA